LHHYGDGRWKRIALPDDSKKVPDNIDRGPVVDVLCNVRQQLRCCVIAFDGAPTLFQTKTVFEAGGEKMGDDDLAIEFYTVTTSGDVEPAAHKFTDIAWDGCRILGINQNCRLRLLSEHVAKGTNETLLFPSLCDYIGAGRPRNLLDDIPLPPLESIKELNEEQQLVAHPLCLKTARKVAGPPGTGKWVYQISTPLMMPC
jgi:hypothetical protein